LRIKALRVRAVVATVVAATVVACLGGWYWLSRPTPSQRAAAAVRVDGYARLGRSILDGDDGSHPTTNSAGYLFFGPVVTGDVSALVKGITVRWDQGLRQQRFGNADLIAHGQLANGCGVIVTRLHRDIQSGFLTGASPDQASAFRAGAKDIIDVGLVCPGAR
jgi:hypothetical protein